MRPFTIPILAALFGLSTAGCVVAEPVVVVNARSGVERLSQEEVTNIFLGRYRRLPNGAAALPVDQPETSALRAEFYRKLVNKDLNEINAYWSRLIFSGKTTPPRRAESTTEVLAWVAGNPGGVAYVERNQLDSRFHIVLEFAK